MDGESRGPSVVVIIVAATAICCGVLLTVLSGALWDNYFPLLTIAFYVFAPLPNFICGFMNVGYDDLDGDNDWRDKGYFLTGALVTSGFALPAIFAHANTIDWPPMFLSWGGSVIVYLTVFIYFHIFGPKKSEY